MAGIWKFARTSRSQPSDAKLGLVFNRQSQTFEGYNPGFMSGPPIQVSPSVSVTNRRMTMSDLTLFSRNLSWLMPTDWDTESYTTPHPAWVICSESVSRLSNRGITQHCLPWPDPSMGTLDYCASLHSEDIAKIADPASRIQLYLKSRDTPACVVWGGADDQRLSYRIEGQDFYQAIADSHASCRNALFEYLLGALDFNQPLELAIACSSPGGDDPWVEDVVVRFSPFFRSPRAPAANCSMSLLSYVAD